MTQDKLPMHPLLLHIFKDTRKFFLDMYERIVEVRELTKSQTDMHELANWVYALREASVYLENLSKDFDATMKTCGKLACLFSIEMNQGESIKTDHVTGTVDVKMLASIPRKSKDPEAYAKLMAYLGVDETLQTADALRPHWPGFIDLVSKQTAEGKPLPDGIDPSKTFPEYNLIVRKKKGVDE